MSVKNLLTDNNKTDQNLKVNGIDTNTLNVSEFITVDNFVATDITSNTANITTLTSNTGNITTVNSNAINANTGFFNATLDCHDLSTTTLAFDLINWNHSSSGINYNTTQTAGLSAQNQIVAFSNFPTGQAPGTTIQFTFLYPDISINGVGLFVSLDTEGSTGPLTSGHSTWVPIIGPVTTGQFICNVTYVGLANSDNNQLRFHILIVP